jgi:hypothetical protein
MPDPARAVLRHRLWDAHTQLELDLCVNTRSVGADEVEEAEEEEGGMRKEGGLFVGRED